MSDSGDRPTDIPPLKVGDTHWTLLDAELTNKRIIYLLNQLINAKVRTYENPQTNTRVRFTSEGLEIPIPNLASILASIEDLQQGLVALSQRMDPYPNKPGDNNWFMWLYYQISGLWNAMAQQANTANGNSFTGAGQGDNWGPAQDAIQSAINDPANDDLLESLGLDPNQLQNEPPAVATNQVMAALQQDSNCADWEQLLGTDLGDTLCAAMGPGSSSSNSLGARVKALEDRLNSGGTIEAAGSCAGSTVTITGTVTFPS
jgi:hypothetical protein